MLNWSGTPPFKFMAELMFIPQSTLGRMPAGTGRVGLSCGGVVGLARGRIVKVLVASGDSVGWIVAILVEVGVVVAVGCTGTAVAVGCTGIWAIGTPSTLLTIEYWISAETQAGLSLSGG
jgi:hypothetical protein